MASDVDQKRREEAERRVREVQTQQMAKLIAWENEQRSADLRSQKRVLDANTEKEAALFESHRRAVERAEKDWQEQRERLGCKPGPAPVLALGPGAQRDLNSEYEQARRFHQHRLEALEKRFEQELASCRAERAEQLDAFQKANQARERDFDEERARKAEDQRLGFETLVHRQMQRAERSVGEEFARKGRPPERDI